MDEVTAGKRCKERSEWAQHLNVLRQLFLSVSITKRSFFVSIDACSREHRWQRAASLTQEARRQTLETTLVQYNTTINACAKHAKRNAWKQGISLFRDLAASGLQPKGVTFSATTSGFAKGSQWRLACCALEVLCDASGARINPFMHSAAQSACVNEAQWLEAVRMLAEAYCKELEPSIVPCNLTMSACQKSSQWEFVCKRMDLLVGGRLATCANAFTCSVAISACSDGQQWQLALAFLVEAESNTIQLDMVACNSAISACEKGQQWQLALLLLYTCLARNMQSTIVSFNAAISACEKAKEWQLALSLLLEGLVRSLEPTIVSYNAAMSACEKGGQWQLVLAMLKQLVSSKTQVSTISLNVAISACDKGDQWQSAVLLLGQFEEQTLEADVVSFNAAISACARAGAWQQALRLLDSASRNVDTTIITYNSFLSALEKGQQWQRALGLWASFSTLRVEADVISYNSLISACEKDRSWQRSFSLMGEMKAISMELTPITYGAATSACVRGEQAQAEQRHAQNKAARFEVTTIRQKGTVEALTAVREGLLKTHACIVSPFRS